MIQWGQFSPKALDFIQNSNARLNIAHGSVRSSKTANCDVCWVLYLLDQCPPGDVAMFGKTLATLQRNVLNDIFDMVGQSNYKWINRQQGELILLGRKVYCFGANNEDAEGKIRGATFAGAYCDEVSLYPKSVWDMLITRMSVSGARIYANCNPGDPDHWFYTDVIMNEEITDKKVWHFTLDDNPNLDKEYRLSLEQSFQGVFYDRMILGLWVVAEGVVYRTFADDPERFIIDEIPKLPSGGQDLMFATIAIDFGGNGAGNAFNCTGFARNLRRVYTLDDWWNNEDKDANQIASDFVKFVKKQLDAGYNVVEIRADHENTIMVRTIRNALRNAGIGVPVKNAIKGRIWNRIEFYSLLFGMDAYSIMRHCTRTIDAFKKCRWHPKHKDERLDDGSTNMDNIDAQEYTTEPFQKKINDMLMLLGGTNK